MEHPVTKPRYGLDAWKLVNPPKMLRLTEGILSPPTRNEVRFMFSLIMQETVKCNSCGWIGERQELVKVSRTEGYDEVGEPILVENYTACPICKEELY